jgi:hypothetical protein
MSALFAELQEIAASGDLAHGPRLLDQLEAEFDRVCLALKAEQSASR